MEHLNRLRCGRHVGAFGNGKAAVLHKCLGGCFADLVLRGAGQGDVAGDLPYAGAVFIILCIRMADQIIANALAFHFLQLLHTGQIDAAFVVDKPVGIRHGDDLAAQLGRFFAGIDCHVSGTGYSDSCAVKTLAGILEHVFRKITQPVAGGFGSHQTAAVGQAFTGEHAGEFVAQPLILAKHITDLAAANTDIAGRHVCVGPDIL